MADNDREPKGKRTDRRVLIVSAILVAVLLVLFLIYDAGFRQASDTISGGPDDDTVPPQTEETAPAAPPPAGG